LIFRWRNDPRIVRLGSLGREVSWNEHERWFNESLSGDERKIFVIQHDEMGIGQVRFDRTEGSHCVISVYLAPGFTGRGWGVEAIEQACAAIFDLWPVEAVLACVRADNHAAHSAFHKAGFARVDGRCGSNHSSFLLLRSTR
jgi:RimJ/RimL family protein N-acetyltransferase